MARVEDIKIRSQKYWTDRFTAATLKNMKLGDAKEKDINKIYRDASKEMDKEIQSFYAKHGIISESPTFETLDDGTQVTTGTAKKLIVTVAAASVLLKKGTRLTRLQSELTNILKGMSNNQNIIMKSGLSDTAEGMFADTVYELYRGVGIGTSFNLLTEPQVLSLIRNPVNGQSFSTRIWNNRDKLANTVNQTLSAGITQGLSNNEMTKRIQQDMGSGFNVANRLLRTEVTNSSNQASLIGYENSGIVNEYEYIATLDNRTSEICTSLDGQIFKTSEAVTGLNFPPVHVNCRSTTAAHFDTSKQGITRIARDLGGNTFTVPASMNVSNFKAIYIDKTLTREQWDNGKRI